MSAIRLYWSSGFQLTACDDVLEADIKGCIGVGSEGISVLADDIFGLAVFVANRVLYLR
jgi:hypothetical protein